MRTFSMNGFIYSNGSLKGHWVANTAAHTGELFIKFRIMLEDGGQDNVRREQNCGWCPPRLRTQTSSRLSLISNYQYGGTVHSAAPRYVGDRGEQLQLPPVTENMNFKTNTTIY
jgi:hypothetical protein